MFSETKITEIYCMADDFLYVQLTLEGMVRILQVKRKEINMARPIKET